MARLYINGTYRKGTIANGTLRLTWDDQAGGSANFTMLLLDGLGKPQSGQIAEVWSDDGTEKLWAGPIEVLPERPVGRGSSMVLAYAITVGSFRKLARRKLALARYVSVSAGEIARDIIRRWAPQLGTALIEDGPIVAEWSVNLEYPDDTLAELAKSVGYVYDVDVSKNVVFKATTSNPAPFSLTDTSANFEGLEITTDRSQLRNSVLVVGGQYPGEEVTEIFTGASGRANFQLTRTPYQAGRSVLLVDSFSGNALASTWNEADVLGGGQIPGNFVQVYADSLQATGNPGAWGLVGVTSKALFDRKSDRRLETDVMVTGALGDFALGWHDGQGFAQTDLAHGLLFEAAGTLAVQEGATRTALAGRTYASGVPYRVRIILKPAGADYWIQGGTYGAWGSRTWTKIHSSTTGTQAYLAAAPLLFKSGSPKVDNFVLRDAPVGITVDVDGVSKVPGIEQVDEASGVDVIVSPNDKLVRFFGASSDGTSPATIPATGSTITVKYRPAIPVITRVIDQASISAVAALEGGDGIIEGKLSDSSLESLEAARAAGRKDLDEFANPQITARYTTLQPGLRPWQLQTINTRGLNTQLLIRTVEATEVGLGTSGAMVMSYQVTAGSRLLGVEDYLRDLIAKGKRIERGSTEQLDDYASPSDVLALSDSATATLSTTVGKSALTLGSSTNGLLGRNQLG